jgi:hypothetical protein
MDEIQFGMIKIPSSWKINFGEITKFLKFIIFYIFNKNLCSDDVDHTHDMECHISQWYFQDGIS